MNKEFSFFWKTTDLESVKKTGQKVFSCFCGGGGSSYGYKMSGMDVIGGCDSDPMMKKIYELNHNPKILLGDINSLIQDIQIGKYNDSGLFNLDILDGSPPCTTFSQHSAWRYNKEFKKYSTTLPKKFKEGGIYQNIDKLYYRFIDLAILLRPKIIISENVEGILRSTTRKYVEIATTKLKRNGYFPKVFLLNFKNMGLPQNRIRVFIIAGKKNSIKNLNLKFNYKINTFRDIEDCIINPDEKRYKPKFRDSKDREIREMRWKYLINSRKSNNRHKKTHFYNYALVADPDMPLSTITTTSGAIYYHHKEFKLLDKDYFIVGQSFPIDYNFGTLSNRNILYVLGMSVPPLTTHRISQRISDIM